MASPFLLFEIVLSNVWLRIDTREDFEVYMVQNRVCGGNVGTVAVVEYMPVSVYFVSEGQITQSPSVIIGQVVTESYVSLLFSGERGNHHCDALLCVEE
jgi:hypothetical protein